MKVKLCALLRAPLTKLEEPKVNLAALLKAKEWEEDEHPRDDEGQFTTKGNGNVLKDGQYVDQVTGKPLPKKDQERLAAMKVPKAWTDVRLNPDEEGALQVVGRDAKGRAQYLYSAAHSEAAAAEKYARNKEFHEVVPKLRAAALKDMKSDDPDRAEAAAVLYLIDRTAFRIGSDRETLGDVKAHGASTLEAKHVSIKGNTIRFEFTGKKGVTITKELEDPELARFLSPRVKAGGRLFPKTRDAEVRDYLKSVAGDKFKVKDYRTWHATSLALRELSKYPERLNSKEFKKAQAAVSKVVAAFLGNTPTVARASYIDPAVWHRWDGSAKKMVSPEKDDWELMQEFFETHHYDTTPQNWRTMPETGWDPDDPEDELAEKLYKGLLEKYKPQKEKSGPINDPNWPKDKWGRYLPKGSVNEWTGVKSTDPMPPKGAKPTPPKKPKPPEKPKEDEKPTLEVTKIKDPDDSDLPPSMMEAKTKYFDVNDEYKQVKEALEKRIGSRVTAMAAGGVTTGLEKAKLIPMIKAIDTEMSNISAKVDMAVVAELDRFTLFATKTNIPGSRASATYASDPLHLDQSGLNAYRPMEARITLAAPGQHNPLRDTEDTHVGKGSWWTNFSYGGSIRHEFGHHVHYSLMRDPPADGAWLNVWHSRSQQEWKSKVSTYAGTNAKELFAEAFAAWTSPDYDTKVMAGKTNALPKEITDYFDTWISKSNTRGRTKEGKARYPTNTFAQRSVREANEKYGTYKKKMLEWTSKAKGKK